MSPVAPSGALRSRAREALEAGPVGPVALARRVLRLERVEPALADRLVGTLLGDDPGFERRDGRWRLATRAAGAVRGLAQVPFVVVDVETTGGQPPRDRITEIAAVRVRRGRIEAEWTTLVDPGRSIPWHVQRLTGIEDGMVRAAPTFAGIADEFLAFLGGAPFVGHNARFDWRFVNAELLHAVGATLTNARLCTVQLARRLLPGVRRRNLDALAHLFGIPLHGRHRALPDARATARVLLHLLDVAGDQGLATEADLARLSGLDGTLYPTRP